MPIVQCFFFMGLLMYSKSRKSCHASCMSRHTHRDTPARRQGRPSTPRRPRRIWPAHRRRSRRSALSCPEHTPRNLARSRHRGAGSQRSTGTMHQNYKFLFFFTTFMLRVTFSPAPDCVEVHCWNRVLPTRPANTLVLLLLLYPP